AFFLGADRKLLTVALPGETLSSGMVMSSFGGGLSVNDASRIAFRATQQRDLKKTIGTYVWEDGTITPLAVVGQATPDGGTVTGVSAIYLNNQDPSVLVAAILSSHPRQVGLYRFSDGQLKPLVVPGQEMPGGGKLRTIPEHTAPSGSTAVW